ncbi:hypothetical protein [Synoicihabitans lomoniglobus]|uniref:Cytochrome c domain-containing protein n=1 Tax=Synoicihabitans lomoniglobus TaxID=2909285 RepID=A0AAE9ZSH5_9BACT|nr:hypothetical protein [Opitutaceae bacterium LMO-M01]WED63436.1 hypothetical protein PXH66_13940 [Opitutaceae bacterium LMO-M01]
MYALNQHRCAVIFFGALFMGSQAGVLAQDSLKSTLETLYQEEQGLPDFPDFGFMLSADSYHDRVFVLAQDFPQRKPKMDAGVKRILDIDFETSWRDYIMEVRRYVFEGNARPDGIENSFFLEDNKVRDWFHVPWQHWGPTGREGFHGLTQEGPINERMLGPQQTQVSHAYAVGFYNDLGGYKIGQVWADPGDPNLAVMAGGKGFPIGTVVAKLLFTTLDETQVPYLTDPVTWQAYVYAKDVDPALPSTDTSRMQAGVQLIQMDIMVRDPRADETGGWVFGTFVYNGEMGEKNRWANLVPVGLMWGNDPDVRVNLSNPTPTVTRQNPALKETKINDRKELPPTHLGWGFRLNGPVDNPLSSCMSCHSTAQYPVVTSILPFLNNPPANPPASQGAPADDYWMQWFRNIDCGHPFNPGRAIALDYSLQLSKSIENFVEYKTQIEQGLYSVQYWENGNDVHRGTLKTPAKP